MNFLKQSLRFLGLGFFVSAGFFLGSCFHPLATGDKAPYKELKNFSKVLQFIETQFVDPVDVNSLIAGAIKGMLQTLDPHSAYLTPEIYRDIREETSGSFGGLGVQVTIEDKVLTVIAPIEDSPAYKAGIQAGDKIVKIEGKVTKELTLPEASLLMKGKPGTKIRLTILRKDLKPFDVVVTREIVSLKSVKSAMLDGHVGYLRIASFSEKTSREIEEAIERLQKDKKLAGFLLDLRGNPGGLLDQAVKVSNFFIDEGPIVYTIGRDKEKKEVENAHKGRKLTDLPLVVIIDGATASASEIVAGALQDYGRALVAGQQSFGKGSVQSIISIGDDAGLKLTVARYFTPAGRSIQAKGIEPDVYIENLDEKALKEARVKQGRAFREKDLVGHIESQDKSKKEEDAQILHQDKSATDLKTALQKDYMVTQSMGILKTVKWAAGNTKTKPVEFKLQE
jgi:carboxyl-terminal processing protease